MRLTVLAALALVLGLVAVPGAPARAIDLSPEAQGAAIEPDDAADDTPDPEVIVEGAVIEVGRDGMVIIGDVTGAVNVLIPGPPQPIKVGDRLKVRGETDDTQPVPVLVAQEIQIGQGPVIATGPGQ